MSQNRTVTEYITERFWENGDSTLSFKMDEFTRKRLMEIPDGTYVQIKRSNREGKGSHYMTYKAPAEQQAQNQGNSFPY